MFCCLNIFLCYLQLDQNCNTSDSNWKIFLKLNSRARRSDLANSVFIFTLRSPRLMETKWFVLCLIHLCLYGTWPCAFLILSFGLLLSSQLVSSKAEEKIEILLTSSLRRQIFFSFVFKISWYVCQRSILSDKIAW